MDVANTYDDNPVVARFPDDELNVQCKINRVALDAKGSVCRLDMRVKEIYIAPRVMMEFAGVLHLAGQPNMEFYDGVLSIGERILICETWRSLGSADILEVRGWISDDDYTFWVGLCHDQYAPRVFVDSLEGLL